MTTRRSAKMIAMAAALAMLVSTLVVPAAWATGPQPGSNGQPDGKSAGAPGSHGWRGDRHHQPAANPHQFGPSYPFGYNYKGPSYPFGQNYYRAPSNPPTVYVKPGHHRWVSGYWGRQWVPQYYTYQVWVPGYWDVYGAWIPGYFDTRAAESGGYYQQVWVDGYWTD